MIGMNWFYRFIHRMYPEPVRKGIEEQLKIAQTWADREKEVRVANEFMETFPEYWVYYRLHGGDGPQLVIGISIPNYKDHLAGLLRWFARKGYTQTQDPYFDEQYGARTYYLGTIVLAMTGQACRRVKVGSHTEEITDYKVECE